LSHVCTQSNDELRKNLGKVLRSFENLPPSELQCKSEVVDDVFAVAAQRVVRVDAANAHVRRRVGRHQVVVVAASSSSAGVHIVVVVGVGVVVVVVVIVVVVVVDVLTVQ